MGTHVVHKKKVNKEKTERLKEDIKNVKYIRSLIGMGYFEKAEKVFNVIYGEDTLNPMLLIEYAKINLLNENYEKCVEVCEDIQNLKLKDNDRAYVNYLKGEALYALEDYENALSTFKEAYQYDSHINSKILFKTYSCLAKLEKFDEAIKVLKKLIYSKDSKDDPNVLNKAKVLLSCIYLNNYSKKGLTEAKKLINSVDKKNLLQNYEKGFYFDYLFARGKLEFVLNHNYIETEKYLKKAIHTYENEFIKKTNPNTTITYICCKRLLAIIKINAGEVDEAISILNKILEIDNMDKLNHIKTYAHISKVLISQNKCDKALEILTKLYEKFPDDQYVQYIYITSLIEIDIQNKDFESAKQKIFDNLDNVISKNDLYEQLVNIYLHQGEFYEAKIIYYKMVHIQKEQGKKYSSDETINKLRALFNGLNGIENNYFSSQVANFTKEKTIEHIKKHFDDKTNHTEFNTDLTPEEIYEYSYNNINNETYIDTRVLDRYYIPFKNVGINSGETINHVIASAIPGTKNIITIFPTEKFTSIDDFDEQINFFNTNIEEDFTRKKENKNS